jgi:uncharacterized protein (DUF983 family)
MIRNNEEVINLEKKVLVTHKFECPGCGGHYLQFRKTDGLNWCRRCGTEFRFVLKEELPAKPVKKAAVATKTKGKAGSKAKAKG